MDLKEVLKEFDQIDRKGFDEHDVEAKLRTIEIEKESQESELFAETMAFGFIEEYKDDTLKWGTYFGPMMVMPKGDGQVIIYPAIQKVSESMLHYWTERGDDSMNPVLKARYFGLVFDFQEYVTSKKPTHTICRKYIKSLIDIAKEEYLDQERAVYTKLKRALELSIRLNDNLLIEECKSTILEYEDKQLSKRESPFLGSSFDLLFLNKKVYLTDQEDDLIIGRLKNALNDLSKSTKENANPWQVEQIVRRIVKYYQKKGQNDKIPPVLDFAKKEYEKIMTDAADMQQINWLRQLHNLFVEFNQHETASEILMRLREVGPGIKDSMQEISTSMEIPKKDLDKFIADMISGTLEDVLIRFAVHYIPTIEDTKKQVLEQSKHTPLTYMITNQLYDEKGRVLATINPLSEDLNGHLIRQVSMNLNLTSLFVRQVIKSIREKFRLGPKRILRFLQKCPLIDEDRLPIIEMGIKAYLKSNHIVAMHLLIPQIEEAIRKIVETGGGVVLKPNNAGGYYLKTFDEILRDSIVTRSIGEDFCFYLRILFTDVRGWNLRNDLSHGIASSKAYNQQSSDRVFHALLCLRLIIKKME